MNEAIEDEAGSIETPDCPACGRTMRLRTARRGARSGQGFWSCTGYPDECDGTLPFEDATEVVEPPALAAEAPICPDCDSPMELRTARRGKNAGESFWGCSRFPACRGARSLSDAPETTSPPPFARDVSHG